MSIKYDITWDELKNFVRKQKFGTRADYWNYIKKNKLQIPLNPDAGNSKFKKYWVNWNTFLENGKRGAHLRNWRSFKKVREYARSFNFNSSSQWISLSKSKEFPMDVPTMPSRVYTKQWKGWSDLLGNTTSKDKPFVSYNKAKKWMREHNIKSNKQWNKVRKNKPDFIPSSPNFVYKKDWKGSADFFGNDYIQNRKYVTYDECKKIAIKNKIKSQRQWQRWAKSGKRKLDIPSNPSEHYKNNGWKNWNEFLETKTKPRKIDLSYEEARDIVGKLRLVSGREYKKFVTKNYDIKLPSYPEAVYKNKGWEGWDKFLQFRRYTDFEEAKKIIQKLGVKSRREYVKLRNAGKIPITLPKHPESVYARRSRNW